MKKTKIINTGLIALSVDIVRPDGKKDAVFLQARSSCLLPSGCKVSNNFLVRNPKVLVKEVKK